MRADNVQHTEARVKAQAVDSAGAARVAHRETRRKEFASPASKCTGQLEKAVGHKGNFTVKSVVGSDNGPPLSDWDASHHRVDRLAHERGHDRVQVRQRRQRVEDVQIGSV